MATLVGNAKYGEGHEIILKGDDQLSSKVTEFFAKSGYTPNTSVFSITLEKKNPQVTIDLGTGKDQVLLKDSKGKIVLVVGSASAINGSFNHHSKNAKSDTKVLTEVKEIISMNIFEAFFELNKTMTEDEVIAGLPRNYAEKYDTTYYQSSIKQLAELKKYIKSKGYTYERQGQDKTASLYKQARELTKLANDNWNPADVWMISKKITEVPKFSTVAELNAFIEKSFNNKTMIPISLKQVSSDRAQSEVVEPAGARKVDEDLSLSKVDLSDTYNNFIVQTKSGFAVRVGFKASASTLNVSLEGRIIGAGYQMGAVDAKAYLALCQNEYKYPLRGGTAVSKQQMDIAKKELKEIFAKYPRISNTIPNYKEAINIFENGNELTKKRFANLISYLYSFLIAPKNFKKHLEFCYFSSKKMSDKSSLYLILK